MSIIYDFYTSPNSEASKEKNPKFHARVVNRQTLDPAILVNHICERSTLGKGDVQALLSELNHEVSQQLLAGNCVYIPGLGYFSLSLQAPSDADPQSTRAQPVKVKRIEFRAEANLRHKILMEATFERSSEKKHSANHTQDEVIQLVREYLSQHLFMTRQIFSELCHFTKGTAQNHLRKLMEEGVIENTNTPRNPIYVLKKEKERKD